MELTAFVRSSTGQVCQNTVFGALVDSGSWAQAQENLEAVSLGVLHVENGIILLQFLEAATDAVAFNVLLSEVPEVHQTLRLLEKMRKMVLLPTVVTMNAGDCLHERCKETGFPFDVTHVVEDV